MAVFKHIVINTRFAFIFVFVLFLLFISPSFIFSFLLFLDLAANGFLRRFLFWGWWFCFFIFILMGWTIDTVSSLNYLEQIRGRKTLQLSGSSTLCSFIRLVSVRWSLLYVNPKKKNFMLPCVCFVKDRGWRQNMVKTKESHTRSSRVRHWCSYHILTSSVISC